VRIIPGTCLTVTHICASNPAEKTIEGDLFQAFVAAGAISKANADDYRKSGLVRCARTDKGVHAAGNVISLKLIVEDIAIVAKINQNLTPQIRVWGIERTIGSFSCYQACDSRWYEYLIPTHSFVPPHPRSFLGKKLVDIATECDDKEGYAARQEDVAGFWSQAEERYINPVLESLDESVRSRVSKVLRATDIDASDVTANDLAGDTTLLDAQEIIDNERSEASERGRQVRRVFNGNAAPESSIATEVALENGINQSTWRENFVNQAEFNGAMEDESGRIENDKLSIVSEEKALESAIKSLKVANIRAKKAYRISHERLARVREALSCYVGLQNYHNYTVKKNFRDPSSKRLIKSFTVAADPIVINDTEWLSLKVHGQSFMMHQIRKMVGMAALVVRCGCPTARIKETFEDVTVSIPKVPGLGLLLERPVFDTYNERATARFNRPAIDFTKYQNDIEEFKQREIYQRIFREEEESHQ
jgi:tRNA pseudouridine38-40 synthase